MIKVTKNSVVSCISVFLHYQQWISRHLFLKIQKENNVEYLFDNIPKNKKIAEMKSIERTKLHQLDDLLTKAHALYISIFIKINNPKIDVKQVVW